MSCTLQIVPKADEEFYLALPSPVRREFDLICAWLPRLIRAKSLLAACKQASEAIAIVNTKQLYERMRKYLKSLDWRDLINKAKAGAFAWKAQKPVGLPVSFRNFYKKLCEDNQRVDRDGYRELIKIWETKFDSEGGWYETIPGYGQWPVASRFGHPEGWSERNLYRLVPDLYDSTAERVGAFAASAFRPAVLRRRVADDGTRLEIGEQVEFDDHEYNVKVHFPGQLKAMRPRGFTAVEVLSAFLTPVYKMTLWDEEEEKKLTLRERDFQWFVVNWLTNVGWRVDERGTEFIGELGTAAIRARFAEAIFRATQDKVKVPGRGVFDKPAHAGQYKPAGKGNFKRSALIESSFSLIDNAFARLPAQTGLDRLTAPAEMAGREQEMHAILRAAKKLPLDEAARLRIPFLTWFQFNSRAMGLYAEVNKNPEHELDGWAELGFQTTDWRLNADMPWMAQERLYQLPDAERDAALALLNADGPAPLTRARNLSRHEVFSAEHAAALKAGTMQKLSPWRWCDLMGLEAGWPVTVNKQSMFKVEAREFGPRAIHYLAAVNQRHLPVGEKYLAFINPWAPQWMLLTREDGAAVGLCEQWSAPCRNDVEGIKRMAGKQAHWEAQRRADLNERHADKAEEIAHMREHNEAIMHPERAEEAERQAEQKRFEQTLKATTEDLSALSAEPSKAAPEAYAASMEDLNSL